MSYSTLRRSRTYIVVPRDVDPQNFLYVPETRKVRRLGVARCLLLPLAVVLLVGGALGVAGYFLHQHSAGDSGLLDWPLLKSGEVYCVIYRERVLFCFITNFL